MGKHRRPHRNRIIEALTRAARKGNTNATDALHTATTARNIDTRIEATVALQELDNT